MTGQFTSHKPFPLESGEPLSFITLDYSTFGKFDKNKIAWIFPGIDNEWHELQKLIYQKRYFLICVRMPSGKGLFTLKDMMRMYQLLKKELEIERIHMGIGASMGGQLMLEWATEEPELFEYLFPIATNAVQSAWCIAFNTSQRLCLEMGANGVIAAHAVASLFDSQVEKNCVSTYYKLTKSMDTHNLSRGRQSLQQSLHKIKSKTLVMSVEGDMLFPKQEQEFLSTHIPHAELQVIPSAFGHAGCVLEILTILKSIEEFICRHTNH